MQELGLMPPVTERRIIIFKIDSNIERALRTLGQQPAHTPAPAGSSSAAIHGKAIDEVGHCVTSPQEPCGRHLQYGYYPQLSGVCAMNPLIAGLQCLRGRGDLIDRV
jgi:hypothetical protein